MQWDKVSSSEKLRAFLKAWNNQTVPGAYTILRLRKAGSPARLSKHLEILTLLPVRDLGLETLDLGGLDVNVIVHERCPELLTEERIVAQRRHRLPQRFRQQLGARLVGRIRRQRRIELAVDAVEAGEDLRSHVEIGIGGGLADAVLQPCCGIPGRPEHADHYAAIVAAPDGAIRRQRIGAVALVAVDGRRREHGRGAGMREK